MKEKDNFEAINLTERYRNELDQLNLPDTVVVASESAIKIDAVRRALEILFPDRNFHVVGVKAQSEVDEQPENDITNTGKRNRLKNAEANYRKVEPNKEVIFVSMESGIFNESEGEKPKWVDRAKIYLKLTNGHKYTVTSAGVIFPAEAVDETRVRVSPKGVGFVVHTVGETLTLHGIKDKQNPQNELTNGGFPREIQLLGGLLEVFIIAAKAEALAREHL